MGVLEPGALMLVTLRLLPFQFLMRTPGWLLSAGTGMKAGSPPPDMTESVPWLFILERFRYDSTIDPFVVWGMFAFSLGWRVSGDPSQVGATLKRSMTR